MKSLSLIFCLFIAISVKAQNTLAEHHYQSKKVTNVVINGSFCDVIVSEGAQVKFDAIIKGDGEPGDYTIGSIETGNTVVFTVEKKSRKGWSWDYDSEKLIELEIPKGTTLTIDNSSGDIKIEDYDAKTLILNASSGDITLTRIVSNCELGTTSGDLSIRDLSGDISMRSTSGDQEYSKINGNLTTRSTSGDIEIDGLNGDLRISSTSGDQDFEDLRGTVSANSTSGDIEGDYIDLKDDSRFKSTSGDIEIELANDLDSLSFDLRASSGGLRVGRISGDDELMIDRGGIIVIGISTSGDQSYTN